MAMFPLSRAAKWLSARLIGDDVLIVAVSTDTRGIGAGQLFVALVGERFDGHAFAEQAMQAGAAALLVSRKLDIALPQIVVPDTRLALGRLAAAWRQTLPGKVVGLTGSNGKTSTKEMIAAMLSRFGSVHATRGNLNNDIGLPLTLLEAADQDYLVVEMGANHAGEIAALSAIARPDIALITNAGRAHLEGFGSVEGVARAKGEIISGLADDGVFLLNQDDIFSDVWTDLATGKRLLSFGSTEQAQVRLQSGDERLSLDDEGFHNGFTVETSRGSLRLDLPVPGAHSRMNALAAVAVGEALDLDQQGMAEGLRGLKAVPGRMQPVAAVFAGQLINDTYNANPDSILAAIEVLNALPGTRWLVLGDLGELGPETESIHEDVGRMARERGMQHLWAVGELSRAAVQGFGEGGRHFDDQQALADALLAELGEQDLVLVKGSRLSAMENVVTALSRTGED